MISTMSAEQIAAELQERVKALYRLNAELAAQVDRMRPVVEAAVDMKEHGCGQCEAQLVQTVVVYKEQMAQLAKESGRDGQS